MRKIILAILLLATTPALADQGPNYLTSALCRDTVAGRASLSVVITAMVDGDNEAYVKVMTDPGTGCMDLRLQGMEGIPTYLVSHRGDFTNAAGKCVSVVNIEDVDGTRAFSWLPCDGKDA